ncbi:MAG: UDP-N-acetylglucosamine--N-acetylmuramyl-(pentapeptide) pyrophosphoryl-undecaprenol N-acetylglucosamine transferase [Chloroflexi bacterium]|nr:UDP-N-acetylglucosamine--N-acetylmuramyl-(pentapeptide) pyrophosphoryl-undecaprenol N-acetylglucosamine transferase [Chloroflexota bacterium]
MRLLICAGGTGGGVYPALAVLAQVNAEHPGVQTLWVGGAGGIEADLVTAAGVPFKAIPAAGVHGVGLRALPGNVSQVMRGIVAARRVFRQFDPDVMLCTGGYVAVPMALAGLRVPTVLYVPDIEPGLALKTLARFADRIAVTAEDSRAYFTNHSKVVVTGYPTRPDLDAWEKDAAYRIFRLAPDLPTLLVTGGSLGALSINEALVGVLPELLAEMQVIHLTGTFTWPQFENTPEQLAPELAARYRVYPYLHAEMGAAFTLADLVLSRAGASSLGELPHFGLPAILVPYPYAWRYQKVNAEYLARRGAALVVEDAELPQQILPLVLDLMCDTERREKMKVAMQSLARPEAAKSIAGILHSLASGKGMNHD